MAPPSIRPISPQDQLTDGKEDVRPCDPLRDLWTGIVPYSRAYTARRLRLAIAKSAVFDSILALEEVYGVDVGCGEGSQQSGG